MELVACWFCFVKLVTCLYWFFFNFKLFFYLLHWFFSSWNWFCSWILLCTEFVRGTFCVLFLFMKFLACFYFSSWNSQIDFSSRETDFVHETCWVLIFYSRNLLYVDFSLRETCIFIFLLLKVILFMNAAACIFLLVELVACWFLLVKLVYFSFQETLNWFPPSWHWFYSRNLWRTEYFRGTFCVLIFVCKTSCMSNFLFVKLIPLIFLLVKLILLIEIVACWFLYMKFVECWFFRETYCILIFSEWNLYIDFSPRETDFVHETCCVLSSWNLLRADFYSLRACVCSWNLVHVDFSFRENCTFIFLLIKMILLMELATCLFLFVTLHACWFFSSWNL